MTLAAFNGHEALTFPDYLDLETGKTLTAEPGGTYDVAPAGGRVVPEVPEPWFTPVQFAAGGLVEDEGAAGEAEAEPEVPAFQPDDDDHSAF